MDGCTNYLSQFDVPFRGTGIGLPARNPDCGLDDTGWIGPQPSYPITDCLCAEKEKKMTYKSTDFTPDSVSRPGLLRENMDSTPEHQCVHNIEPIVDSVT